MAALVFALLQGNGRAGDEFTIDTARAAAAKGDAKAQYFLAQAYARGSGVEKDPASAAKYLKQAAEQGFAYAETDLAALYTKGLGVEKDLETAFKWYKRGAEHGDALAQYGLGIAYANGRGVEKDLHQAKTWWRKAAEQNQVEAQNDLGQLCIGSFDGQAATHTNSLADYAEGAKWLKMAADKGYIPSMNNLAFLYENGWGVEKDYSEAARWYRMAAEKGNAKAQGNLGTLYEEGNGVPHDFAQAFFWFRLSARQGDPIGVRYVADYVSHNRLTPDDLQKVDKMVADFLAGKKGLSVSEK